MSLSCSVEWYVDFSLMVWKGCAVKLPWPILRYYPGTCPEGLAKTTINITKDSLPLDRDLNPNTEGGVVIAVISGVGLRSFDIQSQ
jgi:hypothetical protein